MSQHSPSNGTGIAAHCVSAVGPGIIFALARGEAHRPGASDTETQARDAFQHVGRLLEDAGSSFAEVVCSQVFVTEVGAIELVLAIQGDYLIGPTALSSIACVSALVDPGCKVEVQITAITPTPAPRSRRVHD
jgi:enamine deaminase RidA (YjgF/YER057c/UK114 family)